MKQYRITGKFRWATVRSVLDNDSTNLTDAKYKLKELEEQGASRFGLRDLRIESRTVTPWKVVKI